MVSALGVTDVYPVAFTVCQFAGLTGGGGTWRWAGLEDPAH